MKVCSSSARRTTLGTGIDGRLVNAKSDSPKRLAANCPLSYKFTLDIDSAMLDVNIHAKQPFDLHAVILSHGWIGLAPFRRTESGFGTALLLNNGRAIPVTVSEWDHGVRIESALDLDEAEVAEVLAAVTWMCSLDEDLSPFYERCRDEPKLAHVEPQAKGRILRSPTFFEDVVKTMLTTNTSWGGTKRMTSALVELYGAASDTGEQAFPHPAALALTTEEQLRSDAGLGYRAPYVLELAQRIADGDTLLEEIQQQASDDSVSTDEVRKSLLAIKGIGPYAAANLLMLLARYDYIPVDSWARTLVSHEWYEGEPVSEKEIHSAFEEWGEWQGLAYWFWDWDYNQ